jgi:hypothetical protein
MDLKKPQVIRFKKKAIKSQGFLRCESMRRTGIEPELLGYERSQVIKKARQIDGSLV